MIICEECGARNRNDAYVCAECEASLLHLEPIPDEEPAPAKRRKPLLGRRKRQQEVLDEPEYAYDSGQDSPETAEEAAYPDEPEHVYDMAEDMLEAADETQDSPAYQDEPEEDSELRFVFEESADELAPAMESDYEPQEHMAAAATEESEPETSSVAEEQTNFTVTQDEMPAESIEIDLPEYAEAEEERDTETRAGRSREVRVRVARVRTDRYRRAEEAVPSRISVDPDDGEYDGESYDEPDESDRMTPGMIAAIITAASLLVVTMVVLGVLLLGKSRNVPAAASTATPAVSDTVTAETPAPTPEATPEPPIPTTNPE